MKALVKKSAGKGLEMQEVPVPEIGGNDLLVRVTKAAICGTDLHIWNWDEWSAAHASCRPWSSATSSSAGSSAMGANVRGYEVGRARLR